MEKLGKIKTIVVDLDRTLLHTDKTLSPYTLEVFSRCRQKGIDVMIATARPIRTAQSYREALGTEAIVVSNGARILCEDKKTEYGIALPSAERLLNALACHLDLRITLETGDAAYANKPIADYEVTLSDDLVSIAKSEGVIKLLVGLDQVDTLDRVKKELTEDLYYTVAHGRLMQIMDRSATKWNGILTMLEMKGISPDEVAYFGDDEDDVDPLRLCGVGVAVANAIPEAKAVADYVTVSNDEDGVARFIEDKLLKHLD